jgi:ParB family chromosome partitioning protein
VLDRLAEMAETLKAAEGWRWAEATIDFPHGHGLRRIYPRAVEPDAETAARIAALSKEQDRLIERCQEGLLTVEAADQRSDAIEAELSDLRRPTYDDDDRALAGVFVSLGLDGAIRIDRGFVRPDDEPPVMRATSGSAGLAGEP